MPHGLERALSGPLPALYSIWAIWVVTWFAAAVWSRRTTARPAFGSEILYRVVTVAGAFMLFAVTPREQSPKLWPESDALGWAMVWVAGFGILFSWWARIHLGSLWSGVVTRKEGHHVVDTGPYGLVRHPIYTGIIVASFATAVAKGTPIAFAGAAVMTLGWYIKARLEERFLRTELGEDAYDAYAQRVPMLLPLIGV